MRFSIYIAVNTVNGKRYVGATRQPVARRWRQHVNDSLSGSPKRNRNALHKAIVKYGAISFDVHHVASAATEGDMWATEIALIAQERTTDSSLGYNMSPGGDRGPPLTPEWRQRATASRTGRPQTWMTPEMLAARGAAISAAKRGVRPPQSVIDAARAANAGSVHSAERRRKAAEGLIGKPKSEAHRAAMSVANTGKIASLETRSKLSAAGTGRAWTEESLAKASAARAAWHAARRAVGIPWNPYERGASVRLAVY